MLNVLFAFLGFILAVGLLTTVHELGHFFAARKLSVKVTKFSIGFGKSILNWYGKSGTEYNISLIPLGGYVKMADEQDLEYVSTDSPILFKNKSAISKLIIISAGPIANIIFSIVSYWLMFLIGISSLIPFIGIVPNGTPAHLAGFERGEKIIKINNQDVFTWEDISLSLMPYLDQNKSVDFTLHNSKENKNITKKLNLTNWSINDLDGKVLQNLGLFPLDPIEPIVAEIIPNTPAENSGLKINDKILSINNISVETRTQLKYYLQDKANKLINLEILRDNKIINLTLTPKAKLLSGGQEIGFVGIKYKSLPIPKKMIQTQRYNLFTSLKLSLIKTKEYIVLTIKFLIKMLTGDVSLKNIAGPIYIAKYAGETLNSGFEYFLNFLALISISLGVLNMLPVPILDGGQFIFVAIEGITQKKIHKKILEYSNILGFAFLGSIIILALLNDFSRF